MFYQFNQNNTGGSFKHDPNRGISHWVIIEAANANEANDKATSIGIYFNGRDVGLDCSCCGDRWYPTYGKGDEQPKVYDTVIHPNDTMDGGTFRIKWINGPEGYIHYLDGTIAPFWKEKTKSASQKA